MPARRIKIKARRNRNTGLIQNFSGKGAKHRRYSRTHHIDIKRAIRRREAGQAGGLQPFNHQRAIGGIDGLVRFKLVAQSIACSAKRWDACGAQINIFCANRSTRRM